MHATGYHRCAPPQGGVTIPNIVVDKPAVHETGIPADLVLGPLSHNLDLDELFAAYSRLTRSSSVHTSRL